MYVQNNIKTWLLCRKKMFSGGQCIFCASNGHNVYNCKNVLLKERIAELEYRLLTCKRSEIKQRLEKCGNDDLRILGVGIRAPIGIPRMMLVSNLCRHYKAKDRWYGTEISNAEEEGESMVC